MDWDLLFSVTNVIALAGWAALVLLPRREAVLGAVLIAAVGVLCAVYGAMFVAVVSGMVDPMRDAGQSTRFEYTVDGLKAMFAARSTIVIAWAHFLAFDLFVGLWIARDADKRRIGRLVQVPFFLATFLAGPVGLLAWLLTRRLVTRRAGV